MGGREPTTEPTFASGAAPTSRRLFLGSAGLGALPGWSASLPARPATGVVIPTAANPLASAPFVSHAVDLLNAEGVTVGLLDLEHAESNEVERALGKAQVVFVTGGYAMFLLQHVDRTGFDRIAAPAVHSGRLAYIGISAGAALAGPDLHPFQAPDDPGVVNSTGGLALVPFIVLPHRNRGRAARHDREGADHAGPSRFISINDDQAITVEGTGWNVVRSR